MADGKWIAGLSPGMSLVEAARLVLPARFKVVFHYLPLASAAPHRDVEHVHHLRVATRRATAALRLCAACLPGKPYRSLRKRLRRLRRSAGAARDWDVFLQMLNASPVLQAKIATAARDVLVGFAATRRLDAQAELVAVAADEGVEFQKQARALIDESVDWEKPERPRTLGELAVERIDELIDEMEKQATPPPKSYEDLHRLRILGKRLRYSMEVFAGCFAAPFRQRLYPAIEEMQEILGRITDAHVAAERVETLRDHMKRFQRRDWARYRAPIERLLQSSRLIFPRERKQFLAWLPRWQELLKELQPKSLVLTK